MSTIKLDEVIALLYSPLTKNERNERIKEILFHGYLPTITTWRDLVIDGIEDYKICLEFHKEPRCRSIEMDSYSGICEWICERQLQTENLTPMKRRFLIGVICLAKHAMTHNQKNDLSLHDSLVEFEISNHLASKYDLSIACIRNYANLARQIIRINSFQPSIAEAILSENIHISLRSIEPLSKKYPSDLQMLSDVLSKRKAEIIKYESLCEELGWDYSTERTKARKKEVPAITQMPEYDPDSEYFGLAYTIPSWTNSLTRLRENKTVKASANAKSRLCEQLFELSDEISKLINAIKEETAA